MVTSVSLYWEMLNNNNDNDDNDNNYKHIFYVKANPNNGVYSVRIARRR